MSKSIQTDFFGEAPQEKDYVLRICDEITSLRNNEVIESCMYYVQWKGPASINMAWKFARSKFDRDISTKNIRKVSTIYEMYRKV